MHAPPPPPPAALVSRQYVDMSRIRIEGLLAAFPKLVGTGKQHTYVETENVRYVYQPMEVRPGCLLAPCAWPAASRAPPPQGLYVVLVTNKQSNILEDLETLRLVSKLVPEFCHGLEEEDVVTSAFDLIFAFDEVISLGHKENTTVLQVKQNCEMESHEEKLHKMIIQVGQGRGWQGSSMRGEGGAGRGGGGARACTHARMRGASLASAWPAGTCRMPGACRACNKPALSPAHTPSSPVRPHQADQLVARTHAHACPVLAATPPPAHMPPRTPTRAEQDQRHQGRDEEEGHRDRQDQV